MENKLNIVIEEKKSAQKTRRDDAVERFNEKWKNNPIQFDPSRNVMEKERIKRTLNLIHEFLKPAGKKIVDLGCGYGTIAERLAREGAYVHAIDICQTPLRLLEEKNISNLTLNQDFIPFTTLEDDKYDLSISTDLIAHLPQEHYRLYFSEIARVVHPSGHILCSTPIDIDSEDALHKFLSLTETELEILQITISRHSLYIRLNNLLLAPHRFVEAAINPEIKKKELSHRTWTLSKTWFNLNSTQLLKPIWKLVATLLRPINRLVEKSHHLLIILEKICKFFDTGISHVIVIGLRRPLVEPPKASDIPRERKQKRQVWE